MVSFNLGRQKEIFALNKYTLEKCVSVYVCVHFIKKSF